ncbi:hypothetical protein GB937_007310 [Aspergillus fischeri]|nr:hypothetical protein GB937_007310 [Aspergillus fischeri]
MDLDEKRRRKWVSEEQSEGKREREGEEERKVLGREKGRGKPTNVSPAGHRGIDPRDDESTTRVSKIEKRGGRCERKQAREPRPEQAVCFEFGFILELPETNTTSELLGEDGKGWRPEKSGLNGGERRELLPGCLGGWALE